MSDLNNAVGETSNDFNKLKDDAARTARAAVETAKTKVTQGVDSARSYAEDAYGQARSYATDAYGNARSYAEDAYGQARVKGTDALANVEQQIKENPLAALAVAAGVGVVVGLWLRGGRD